MNKSSMRLILIGILLLLTVSLRMITTSTELKSVPAWEQGDQEGVAEVLASATAKAALPLANPTPSQTSDQIPTQLSPQNVPGTPGPGKTSTYPGASNGEVFLAEVAAERTVVPGQAGVPVRLVIPAVGIDAPVVASKSRKILIHADVFEQWIAPDMFAAGWITASALLGEKGNTVLSGHHNEYGEVFGRLVDVNVGDTVLVFSDTTVYRYNVTNRMILQEVGVPDETRIKNAQWIGRSADERLTLVTCWPKDSNTHRLILVAAPD